MKVAFIGAGNIGGAMAACLARKRFDLTVCDMNDAALEAFRELGANTTVNVADCASADVVVIMVATDRQVRSVAMGDDGNGGLLAHVDAARPPAVVIMSSVLPATVRDVAAAMAQKNVRVIDAPVSGGHVAAANGLLTIMVGGEASDLTRVRPLLDALGSNIVQCGPLGAGEAMKIVNNIVGVTNMILMTEAARLALELGMDVDWVAGVMEKSSGRNFATRDFTAHKMLYRHNTTSPEALHALLAVCRKDLALATTLSESAGLSMPLLEAIKAALDTTPDEAIAESWRKLAK